MRVSACLCVCEGMLARVCMLLCVRAAAVCVCECVCVKCVCECVCVCVC